MTHERALRRVVIVGGGTAGWMAASALARAFSGPSGLALPITLVESDAIATIGVGEATIPPIRQFNATVGLDEAEFVRATMATAKLGIDFHDWSHPGSNYFHGFGDYGPTVRGQAWRQYLFRLHAEGRIESMEPWSLPTALLRQNRFAPPLTDPRSVLSSYSYAYQFDAGLFAGRLRVLAEGLGVVRREGRIVEAPRDGQSGLITAVKLDDGTLVEGDLFLDCSGFRGLLIEGVMQAGFEDWTHWLPCDRAVAFPYPRSGAPEPCTRATARKAGWQWRIPLQHRTGGGYVYSSAFISDQEALDDLIGMVGPPLTDPRPLRFTTGRRRQAWKGNVVSLGLSSGFIEPLESTSINLIQTGIGRLLELFPDRDFDPALIAAYNRDSAQEYERVRDFIVLHYHLAGRTDGELWRQCREMTPPDSLAEKIALFRARGEIRLLENESFREDSWAAIFTGLGVWPERATPLVEVLGLDEVASQAERLRDLIARAARSVPEHTSFFPDRPLAAGRA